MCGINTFFSFSQVSSSDIHKIKKMNEKMYYRGPDDSGIYTDDNAILAMVRLSIIGVENGKQPFTNENKRIYLVCNGEIYNYKQLRDELIKKGHQFKTSSDCETIIHLYEEKGTKCLEDLRGMFAFCLWDNTKKFFFAARDRVGEKPIYYSITSKGVVFSSELTTIQNFFIDDVELDFSVLHNVSRYSYPVNREKTHIKQIYKILPGEYLSIINNSVKKFIYWTKKNKESFSSSYLSARKQLLNHLREAISLNMQSEVPIVILLSSGIDSSLIAKLAKEQRKEVHALTVGYKGKGYHDEREIAKKFAKEIGLIWHEIELDENDYESYFYEYTQFIDEPVCDMSSIAQWGLYKKAKEIGFTVLLSGNGSDELFFGYPRHNFNGKILDLQKRINSIYPINTVKSKMKFYKYIIENFKIVSKYIKNLNSEFFGNNFINFHHQFDFQWNNLGLLQTPDFQMYFNSEKNGIDSIYSFLFNVWLNSNCYYLSDKLGMGNSLEIRSPFADYKLIEFVSSLPLNYRYRNRAKSLLLDTIQDILPNYIINKKKKGFSAPTKSIERIIKSYDSKFFKTNLPGYNQVLLDRFLDTHY